MVGRFCLQRRFLAATRFRALLVSDPAWTLLVMGALSEASAPCSFGKGPFFFFFSFASRGAVNFFFFLEGFRRPKVLNLKIMPQLGVKVDI